LPHSSNLIADEANHQRLYVAERGPAVETIFDGELRTLEVLGSTTLVDDPDREDVHFSLLAALIHGTSQDVGQGADSSFTNTRLNSFSRIRWSANIEPLPTMYLTHPSLQSMIVWGVLARGHGESSLICHTSPATIGVSGFDLNQSNIL
jgi:hypothetical protein